MPKSKATWGVNSDHPEAEPYSRNKGSYVGDRFCERSEQNLLVQGKDDGDKAARDITPKAMRTVTDLWAVEFDTQQPGPVSKGGPPRHAPKGDAGLKSPRAYAPEGKYGKPGGRGQRSGA